jgi:hypothetical protein
MGMRWWKKKVEASPKAHEKDPDLHEARMRAAEVVVRGHRVSAQLDDRLARNGFTALAARIMGGK